MAAPFDHVVSTLTPGQAACLCVTSSTARVVMVGGFVGMQTPKEKLSSSVAGPI